MKNNFENIKNISKIVEENNKNKNKVWNDKNAKIEKK